MHRHSISARAQESKARHRHAEAPPRIDDRLAPPETRIEYLDGKKIVTMPADEPHATKHSEIDCIVGAHLAEGFKIAVDMLTRTSKDSDFAPDVSIFPAAPDPKTKRRRLEEISFEIASQQRLGVPTTKARKLVQRGVRRVFCVLVKQNRVLEWSRRTDAWSPLPKDARIEDRCFVRPLPIAALLDAAGVDNEVAEALLVKRPPAIQRALTESRLAGKAAGVLAVLGARGVKVTAAARKRVLACTDEAQMDAWLERAATAEKVSDLF